VRARARDSSCEMVGCEMVRVSDNPARLLTLWSM